MTDGQYATLPPPPPPVTTQPGFNFGTPFSYVFEDPRWLQKILIGGLFYLAGFVIVGWFFIFGYVAQTTRNVIGGATTPLPEWENLGDFFAEGLRLFGVALVYVLPFILIVGAIMIPAGLLGAVDNEAAQMLGGGIASCLSCLIVPLSLAVMFFMPASLLFATVEQRFAAGFEFGRIWAFIRANIGNYALAVVVYIIARFISGFGVTLLCIGVIFTGFWSFLITAHAFAQVYKYRREA